MSTHPTSDDLDRTDELPQLDVVAYEAAQQSASGDPLSTTDTWLVDSLGESGGTETIVRTGQSAFPLPGSVDLSLNVARLRQRISTLESELEAARLAARDAEAAGHVPIAERNELNSRVTALEAQSEHLREQNGIAEALTQRLQQQLRDQAETHKAQLAKAEEAREADRQDAERQRLSLEQQLERSTANFTTTVDEQERMRRALEESRELAAMRARQIDDLQRGVISEQGKAHALARNLAAKLADYDIMSSMVSQRNAAIGSLERTREDLSAQLQKAFDDAHRLSTLLDEANRRAAAHEGVAAEVTARDEQISQLGLELESLRHQLEQARVTHEALETNLHETEAKVIGEQGRQAELQSQVAQLEAALLTITRERDDLLDTRQTLASRTAEVERLTAELDETKRNGALMWSELETHSRTQGERQQELAAARDTIAELQRANEDLRSKLERLHAVSQDDTQLLNERTTQLSQVQGQLQKLASDVSGLETSLHARDSLIETLRGEIRTAQEERSIVSEQLAKARSRVKTMTQQIFNRDNRIATLKADLAVHIEALAAIRQDVDRMDPAAVEPAVAPAERFLEPVNHGGEPILLNRRVMTVGRTNDNDIFIPSKMISRHHARLLVGPNAVIVEDAGSTNGCYVNDQLVKQHVLHEGDVLAIGDMKFRLRVSSGTPSKPAADVPSLDSEYSQDE